MGVLKALLPIIGAFIALTTVITCFIVSAALNHTKDDLTWPFISDAGEDPPEYYVFLVGGIISAIIFVIAWWLICAYLRRVYYADNSSHPRLWVWIVFVLQVIAAIGLVLLVIFDVDDHEGVHIVGAAMFFIATIIGDTVAIAAYYRHAQGLDEQIQRRAKFKLIVLIIIWVLFIIYVPIGYAVSSSLHGESRRGVRQMQAVVQVGWLIGRGTGMFFLFLCCQLFVLPSRRQTLCSYYDVCACAQVSKAFALCT
eukprot:m.174209 g.174209  ORF g.174209 m.174209 type:complete len:254 (-) comp16538_c2_seq1:1569-2330(-)